MTAQEQLYVESADGNRAKLLDTALQVAAQRAMERSIKESEMIYILSPGAKIMVQAALYIAWLQAEENKAYTAYAYDSLEQYISSK